MKRDGAAERGATDVTREGAAPIAPAVLEWFDRHGRHDLPWQLERSAYGFWVAEVMLQQTQVATVIPYYERFLRRFPTVAALAAAELDDVLALWSGLGYYARARNLWRAARLVVERHGGELPAEFAALVALPGIGRSTAGAILAQSFGARHAILDGNVKRVLARYHAVEGWPGERAVADALWAHAERHTPHARIADYTQAIMDLGATLCVRARPACERCPLAPSCAARAAGTQASYPAPRPKRARPRRSVAVLVIVASDGRVLLERRPAHGIWGGLYSLPELLDTAAAAEWCERELGARVTSERPLPPIDHAFTHFDLALEPRTLTLETSARAVMDRPDRVWYKPGEELRVGVPAPVGALLRSFDPGSVTFG